MIGDFSLKKFDSELFTPTSVLMESCSGLDEDLALSFWTPCVSRFLLLCNFSFKCARMCALNSARSVYCFPQMVHIDGFSGDMREDDEFDEEEDSAKEEADSASEHEDAAGEEAMAGEEGEEEDEIELDGKVDSMLKGAVDFTGVAIVLLSMQSGTASIGLPSLILFAIDLAEFAFTTK